jgi:uncharacterized protein YfdQ (DUF2303 family)
VTTDGFVTAISQLAEAGLTGEVLDPGTIYAYRTAGGGVQLVDLTGDKYLAAPTRKRGQVAVRDAGSFLAYWRKHSDTGSEVYADRSKLAVTAVLDAHNADSARFGEHRLTLHLQYSQSFNAWLQRSSYTFTQVLFAEFIEDHRSDVREPVAAELLELAQTFQATTKASFKSSNVLKSGQRQLEYTETIDASAGRSGKLTIPDEFVLALPVFEGDHEPYRVAARLRYRIDQAGLKMIYIIDRSTEIVDAAFEGVIAELNRGGGPAGQAGDSVPEPLGVPILRGYRA